MCSSIRTTDMGKQIAIRTSPEDRARFENHIASLGGLLLSATHPGPTPIILQGSAGVEQKFKGNFWLCLGVELGDVVLRHVDAQGYWMVDQISSPVVEYTSLKQDGQGIGDGRLYVATGHYVGEEWVAWSPQFIGLADSAFTWVRRNFKRSGGVGPYVGPEAARMLEERIA